jgi:hypothetical protein
MFLIPDFTGESCFSTLQLPILQNIDSRAKLAFKVVQRLLPLAVVYQPKWTFIGVLSINFIATFFDKNTYLEEKGFKFAFDGVSALMSVVDWKWGPFLSLCRYSVSNLYNLKNAAFAKKSWKCADHLLNVIDVGLIVAPAWAEMKAYAEEQYINTKNFLRVAFLVYHAFHHSYNALKVLPKVVTNVKSLDTLECGVQLLMIGVRLAQAWQIHSKAKLDDNCEKH